MTTDALLASVTKFWRRFRAQPAGFPEYFAWFLSRSHHLVKITWQLHPVHLFSSKKVLWHVLMAGTINGTEELSWFSKKIGSRIPPANMPNHFFRMTTCGFYALKSKQFYILVNPLGSCCAIGKVFELFMIVWLLCPLYFQRMKM